MALTAGDVKRKTKNSPVEGPVDDEMHQAGLPPASEAAASAGPPDEDQAPGDRALLETPEGMVALAARMLTVRNKRGGLVPLAANRAQLVFEQSHFAAQTADGGRESIVLKARQMGMSTWIAGRFLLRSVLLPGTVTVHVAHTREAATSLFRIVGRMWENLPMALREGDAKCRRNNAGEICFRNDSEVRIVSAAEPNAGRGLTVSQLHLSEVSRWGGDPVETLAGLRAALAPGGEIVLESTPNGAYGCFYTEWQTAGRRGAARHFFPWWWEPGYVAVPVDPEEWTPEETALAALVLAADGTLISPEQIGYRRGLAERFGALRGQEFAEDAVSCFRESGCCYFDSAAVVARLRELQSAVTCAADGAAAGSERGASARRATVEWGGTLRTYLPPVTGRAYVLAVDPSGGGERGDFTAAEMVDRQSGVQCAELHGHIAPRELARRVVDLVARYRDVTVAVERNNIGAAVLAYLESEPAVRVWRDRDGKPGWLTTEGSRDEALARLGVLLSTRPELFRSTALLEECRSFVQKEDGRAEAAAGMHDDFVLAMAIAQAVRVRKVGM